MKSTYITVEEGEEEDTELPIKVGRSCWLK